MLVGSTIGPFEIEKEIGSGAMGTVYRARFHKDEERVVAVALKVVSFGLLGNESAMARFEREAQILKQLRHPHIVRLIATGRYQKTPFIAMEFIDGEPLDAILTRRGRFSWEEVVAYGKQLCGALQYAHEHGIIHRDLKPSNLMLTKDDRLKLTDFGIAKDTDVTALTGANSTIGTAAYMSPEQCKGARDLTAKSDIYSLGIVFFELLTGRKMFSAESTVDMFLKHVNEKPPRPGKLVADMPHKLEALILQMVEKDPEDRPVNAAWVARILGEIEEDAYDRKSAGLDAAHARRVDRSMDGEKAYDEADRDAARALKGKKKKRPRKPVEAVPWYRRKAVKAGALVAALLGIGAIAYYAMKKPAANDLYSDIERARDDDSRLAALDEYLNVYGDQKDERTEFAQKLARDIRARKREEVLTRRFIKGMVRPDEHDDTKAYEAAWHAMESEKAGDLKRASDFWQQVHDRFPEGQTMREPLTENQRARGLWTWVAARRLGEIKAANDLAVKLPPEIEQFRLKEVSPTFASNDPKAVAIRAIRLEKFGDRAKARVTWELLAGQTERNMEQHDWFLLASQRKDLIPALKDEDAVRQRVELVSKALANARQAAEAAATNPNPGALRRDARNACRDIIDLYDLDPAAPVRNAVAEARKLLDTLSK